MIEPADEGYFGGASAKGAGPDEARTRGRLFVAAFVVMVTQSGATFRLTLIVSAALSCRSGGVGKPEDRNEN